MSIAEIMHEDVVTVEPSTLINDAITTMEVHGIRHLPVLDDGRIVGMVSDRDLREYQTPLSEALARPKEAQHRLLSPVSEAMATDIVFVDREEDIQKAVDTMLHYNIGAVPVVDRSTLSLVGMVSYVDILRLFRDTTV
ncbi:MAG: CBS domain-containing protein [Nannocystaceae bacterium]